MIELDIPKDLKDYQPKVIFGLTTRQAICGACALGSALIAYNVAKAFVPQKTAIVIALIFVAIFAAFGWIKQYGLPLEKYLWSQLWTSYIPPKKRLYKIENKYQVLEKNIKKEESEAKKAEERKNKKNNKTMTSKTNINKKKEAKS